MQFTFVGMIISFPFYIFSLNYEQHIKCGNNFVRFTGLDNDDGEFGKLLLNVAVKNKPEDAVFVREVIRLAHPNEVDMQPLPNAYKKVRWQRGIE